MEATECVPATEEDGKQLQVDRYRKIFVNLRKNLRPKEAAVSKPISNSILLFIWSIYWMCISYLTSSLMIMYTWIYIISFGD